MNLQGFLGNEQLKIRLSAMFSQKKIPHCILLSGPEGSGKRTLSKLLAAAMQCTDSGMVPCRVCSQCHKALNNSHPDIIYVDDEDHKTIPVSLVREICADVYIRPNEGNRKIYVFPYAEKLSVAGQNTLLKVLEEPPAYAVFLLLASNPGILLPTVRSRCAEAHLSPLSPELMLRELHDRCPGHTESDYQLAASTGYLGQAVARLEQPLYSPQTAAFAEAFAARNSLQLLELLVPMEKWKRDQILPELQAWEALLTEALSARYCRQPVSDQIRNIQGSRTAPEILRAIEDIRTAEIYCNANVGTAAICGSLAVKLS